MTIKRILPVLTVAAFAAGIGSPAAHAAGDPPPVPCPGVWCPQPPAPQPHPSDCHPGGGQSVPQRCTWIEAAPRAGDELPGVVVRVMPR